ncbi:MAG: RICIN domain-containing protein [Nakamurella sp.]
MLECQQWAVIPTGGNRYQLIVENSGMLLAAVNCGTANGTGVDLFPTLNNNCQEWTIAP